ncbi:MAG: MoaD/ThiS family protein [Planctomycetota bacterium]
MPRVTIQLPSVLTAIVGDIREVVVEGDSVSGCLEALFVVHPELRLHVFDESGSFRQHVLCFHNDTNTRWTDGMQQETQDGDVITLMQAVSGG